MVSFYESILHPNGYIAFSFFDLPRLSFRRVGVYTPPCSLHSLPSDVQAIVDAIVVLSQDELHAQATAPSPRGCGTFVGSSLLHPPSFASADRL